MTVQTGPVTRVRGGRYRCGPGKATADQLPTRGCQGRRWRREPLAGYEPARSARRSAIITGCEPGGPAESSCSFCACLPAPTGSASHRAAWRSRRRRHRPARRPGSARVCVSCESPPEGFVNAPVTAPVRSTFVVGKHITPTTGVLHSAVLSFAPVPVPGRCLLAAKLLMVIRSTGPPGAFQVSPRLPCRWLAGTFPRRAAAAPAPCSTTGPAPKDSPRRQAVNSSTSPICYAFGRTEGRSRPAERSPRTPRSFSPCKRPT